MSFCFFLILVVFDIVKLGYFAIYLAFLFRSLLRLLLSLGKYGNYFFSSFIIKVLGGLVPLSSSFVLASKEPTKTSDNPPIFSVYGPYLSFLVIGWKHFTANYTSYGKT